MAIELLLSILGNHLWQSTLVAAALGGLTLLLRRNNPRVRYFLWLAASLKFLVPFVLLAALGAQIPWSAQGADDAGGVATPVVTTVAARLVAPMEVTIPYPASHPEESEYLDMFLTFGTLAIWLLGTLFVAGRWLLRWSEIRRALRRAELLTTIDFPAPVRSTSQQLEPGVVDVFRPQLLLPAGIQARLTDEQMRAVLAHERCHLRWRDNLTASLHMLVEAVFWFFPPVWWIGKRLIEERERACDEQVVREGHAPERYAEGILDVCEHYLTSRLPCVSGVSGADLRQRIESIVKRTLGLKLDGPRKIVLATVTCCLLAMPLTAGMLAGNSLEVLLSLKPSSAALMQYWRMTSAIVDDSLARNAGEDRSDLTCLAPGSNVAREQGGMARIVAKIPPTEDRALFYAVVANSKADVKRLLDAGAPRRGDGHLRSDSIMHIAAEFADTQVLDLLADAGIAVDGFSPGGIDPNKTPLMTALSSGRTENARWFIAHGADVNATNKWGQSALTPAMINCGHKDLVATLVKAGARPNIQALRIADAKGFDLRTDPGMQGPPLQQYRPRLKSSERTADLDGDGSPDLAAIYRSLDDKAEAVFVRLSSRGPDAWTKAADSGTGITASAAALSFEIAAPGTYATPCAKGVGKPCSSAEPRTVELQHGGIQLRLAGRPGSVFYWDKADSGFKAAWPLDP